LPSFVGLVIGDPLGQLAFVFGLLLEPKASLLDGLEHTPFFPLALVFGNEALNGGAAAGVHMRPHRAGDPDGSGASLGIHDVELL